MQHKVNICTSHSNTNSTKTQAAIQ